MLLELDNEPVIIQKLQSKDKGGWAVKGDGGYYLTLKKSQIEELMNILDNKNGKLNTEDFEQKITELNEDNSIYTKILEYEAEHHKEIYEQPQEQEKEEEKKDEFPPNVPEAFKKAYAAKLKSNGKKQLNGDDCESDSSDTISSDDCI